MRAAAAGLLMVLSGACAAPPAAPAAFAVAHEGPERVELQAAGRRVVVAAPAGLCVRREGVALSDAAAVVMIDDCAAPQAFRRTVLVGDAPLADDGAGDAALDEMAKMLALPDGWRSFGLGQGGALDVMATRRAPGVLFIVVQDREPPRGRRCRAFTEVAGRLAVVTVAAPDAAAAPDALLADAAAMVAALRDANAAAARPRQPVWGAAPTATPLG